MAALRALVLLGLLGFVAAECPNACSGHGDCTAYDKCSCYRNWQAADCSQRVCPFGLAHVDVPKGDLDGSADPLDVPSKDAIVQSVDVYGTWGTTELYPLMTNSAGEILENTAHWYVECSNKGLCDRKSGVCKCFAGYEGTSCQRASCPSDCSGHGTCQTIETIAKWDNGNEYKLWDRDMTMGCYCDPGYTGADCSLRQCKHGIDPLYTNLYTTANMPSWRISFDVDSQSDVNGTYAIKFYDTYGEDYVTEPITHLPTDYSADIKKALEALPNSVVPLDSVKVSILQSAVRDEYTITFTKNPGALKQIEVLTNLDGMVPTLFNNADSKVGSIEPVDVDIYSSGSPGEFTDHFTTFCEGVTAYVVNNELVVGTQIYYAAKLVVTSAYEARLLKQCLGDADGNTLNNVCVENWDLGAHQLNTGLLSGGDIVGRYPHALKLVKQNRADIYDSGHTYLAWFKNDTAITPISINTADGAKNSVAELLLLSRQPITHTKGQDEPYYVFGTDGIVEKISYDGNGDKEYTDIEDGPVVAWWEAYTNVIYTNFDASCEEGGSTRARISNCIKKGDILFLPAGYFASDRDDTTAWSYPANEGYALARGYTTVTDYTGMMYTVTKVWTEPVATTTKGAEDRYRIQVDKNINWNGDKMGAPWGKAFGNTGDLKRTGIQQIFKFTPNSGYTYVAECANRGVCDRTTGVCNCFKGYTNDNCDTQSALAI